MSVDVDSILEQIEQLSPEERVEVVEQVIRGLLPAEPSPSSPVWRYGACQGPRMSTEDDFRLAEWHPAEEDLRG